MVLPCGSGKTIVGLAVMAQVQQSTLILTTGHTSVAQWRRELLEKTTLSEADIAEYTGAVKDIGPVTLTTYQMLTHRAEKSEDFPHLRVFDQRNWGLIIYDEVHLLPAPVFRVTAEVQARRRLGLTATLVREDGREGDVFSLIGPKKYDVPWRDLEGRGWIAEAACTEVRCALPRDVRMAYATALPREKFRIAAENPVKGGLLQHILARHPGAPALIIGQYLDQLKQIAAACGAPLITGKTAQRERERLYGLFRTGELSLLVLSKVGNFALDLPDAEVLVQVSGTFGSRQEEAQRLGRVLHCLTPRCFSSGCWPGWASMSHIRTVQAWASPPRRPPFSKPRMRRRQPIGCAPIGPSLAGWSIGHSLPGGMIQKSGILTSSSASGRPCCWLLLPYRTPLPGIA